MSISQNLITVKQQVIESALACQRDPQAVQLLAVSKTKPIGAIEQAIKAGQYQFGENYVQEGIEKIQYFDERFPEMHSQLVWHFIGALQSNKTRLVAAYFDWVQTIDRLKIAQRLSEQRPTTLPPLNVLIQINISEETTKAGILPTELFSLANEISLLPRLSLRGLMAIPKPEDIPEKQQIALQKMQSLFAALQTEFPTVDTLSMGMSADMQSAIECGSTMVRIGTAIFGTRA